MPHENGPKDVSSSEITATYRCVFPELSGDTISSKLVSHEGKQKADAFIKKYDYSLARRKISICAGYFLKEVTRMLSTNQYDSCISFASGFSLLLYLISDKVKDSQNIKYFDTDLPYIIDERQKRLAHIKHDLNTKILTKIQHKAFDIEKAYQQNLSLRDVFPDCHRPIFIADGVSYFLSHNCIEWLIEQTSSYSQSALTLYYWPDDMLEKSNLFARVYKDLNQGMILEELKSFWDINLIKYFQSHFPYTSDYSLAEAEEQLVAMTKPKLKLELLDTNQYFPVRLITGEKFDTSGLGKRLYAKL